MSFLLSDFKQYLKDYDFDNNGTRGDRIYTKIANDALRELYSSGDFDFTERQARQSLAAPYNTGTVSITAGGTAITGVGTTFTTAMTGRYIRFNGESQQYKITYVGATSLTSSDAYLGSADLSGASYQITDERFAVPTTEPFRAIKRALIDAGTANSGPCFQLQPVELAELYQWRLRSRVAMIPRMYSFEWVGSASAAPTAFVWIHPPPDVKRTITYFYTVWPLNLASASDPCAIPFEAEGILREFGLGCLYREQGRREESGAQLARARGLAKEGLATTRAMTDSNSRRPWYPEYDDRGSFQRYWPTYDPNTPMV